MTFWQDLERHAGRVAFVTAAGDTLDYAALACAADAVFDLPRGTPVLLALDNDLAAMIAYLGALRRGLPAIVTAAGDTTADRERADRLIAAFRPAARWSSARGTERLRDAGDAPAAHPGLALLLSTSGSTGATKLVRLSARAVDANAHAIAASLALTPDERAITTLPPGYAYGLSVIHSHLAVGATTILYAGSVVDPAFRAVIERHRATSFGGVPHSYELLDRAGFLDSLPESLRTLTQAGGRLAPELLTSVARRARAAGKRFVVMYGQTEAVARIATLDVDPDHVVAGGIGRAIPGGTLTLVDPETGAFAATAGELVYTGPNVMMGYAEAAVDLARGHELTALRTGDLAERLPDGAYRVTGRRSRFIKPFGLRVALDEVEQRLAAANVSAVAAGDDALLVVAVLAPGDVASAERFVADKVGLPASHRAVLALDAVPRLASGKVDYPALLAAGRAAAGAIRTAASAGALRAALAAALGRDRVEDGDSFRSLAGDSLSYVRASLAIEEVLGTLPERWEELTVARIEALARPTTARADPGFRWVATDVLLRPAAIALVVASHVLGDPANRAIKGGALALMILAGYGLARFQSRRLLGSARWGVIRDYLLRVVAPFLAILLVYRALTPNRFGWQTLLLLGNIVHDPGVRTMAQFWFVPALFHCTLALLLLLAIPPVRRRAERSGWAIGFPLLSLALAAKVAGLALRGAVSADDFSTDAWAYAITLGWLASYAETGAQRWTVILVTALVTALDWGASDSHALIAEAVVAALLLTPRVLVRREVAAVLGYLARSSLFAYLTQGITIHLLRDRLGIDGVAPNVVAALTVGALAYAAWEQLMRRLRDGWRGRGRRWPARRGVSPVCRPSRPALAGRLTPRSCHNPAASPDGSTTIRRRPRSPGR
ncbi:AMP-binding protein [Sphingomonas sp. RRHST34]|uniref:AMP-binding protein n=1 Tax=Sphingomonas citri TaxID=2862499 RepID=A0ABS7BJB2_9SPHN|nr:AMP-binding protein [Sphingomonas citri]MBW6529615.1 AMP-binding protein [Sphingomonas citri]